MSMTRVQSHAPARKLAKSKCCEELNCETGLRNNYFVGKEISPDSFRTEQQYSLERRRLLNRAVHGWGVVYGLDVAGAEAGSLMIEPGLALDQHGRELLQSQKTTRALSDFIVMDACGNVSDLDAAIGADCDDDTSQANKDPICMLLQAHYAERDVNPVNPNDSCHCNRTEWDYTCETVVYTLKRADCEKCFTIQECAPAVDLHGSHDCLCSYVAKRPFDANHVALRTIDDPCGRFRFDVQNGVPLACVTLKKDDCNRWVFDNHIDACSPRQLVKCNDLLFDLIPGRDLTRISEIGWAPWHRSATPVSFDAFSKALGTSGNRLPEYVTEDFWVRFSRPVRDECLRPDVFAMTVISSEREGGWWQTFRVPITRIELAQWQAGDPTGHVRGARIIVDGAWIEDAVRGRRSLFQGGETTIEIEVRGDFIIDCNGRAVDANAVGLTAAPTGNGTAGGTFFSTFRVAASGI